MAFYAATFGILTGNFLGFYEHNRSRPSGIFLCLVISRVELIRNKFFVGLHGDKAYNLFVETPRKFITAKLSIRKPGFSSVLIICGLKPVFHYYKRNFNSNFFHPRNHKTKKNSAPRAKSRLVENGLKEIKPHVMPRRPCMFVVYSIYSLSLNLVSNSPTILLYLKSQEIGCNTLIKRHDTQAMSMRKP